MDKKKKASLGIYVLVGTVVLSNLFLLWYYAFPPEIQKKFPSILQAFLPIVAVFPNELFETYLREFIEMRLYWVSIILVSALGLMFLNRPARSVFIVFNIIHIITLGYIVLTKLGQPQFLDYFFKLYFNMVAVLSYVGFLTIAEVRNQFQIVSNESGLSLLFKKLNLMSQGTSNPNAHYNLGLAYSRLERYDDAVELLKKAAALNPKDANVHFQLGTIYNKQKKFNEAINAFKETVRLDPFHGQACAQLGIAYKHEGCYPEAVRIFEKAINLKSDTAEVYRELGESYASVREHNKAIAALIQAARLDPQDENVYYQLGLIYISIEQMSKAREALQKAANLNTKVPDIHFQLGVVCLKLNLPKDAIRAFKEVLRLEPDHKKAHYQLGFAYTLIPDMISAERQYNNLKDLDPDLAANLKLLIR